MTNQSPASESPNKSFICQCGHSFERHKNTADHEQDCIECHPHKPCYEFLSADESLRHPK